MKNKDLESKLVVGTKIKIGPKYAKESPVFDAGEIIILEEGEFYYYNGLYEEERACPAVWNEHDKDWDSIYHLFENDLSGFFRLRGSRMNLNEQDARKLQELHFHWDYKYNEFYRDWNLPGNNYMTLRLSEDKWVLYEFMGEDHDGAIEDWTEFNSLGEVLEYFGK